MFDELDKVLMEGISGLAKKSNGGRSILFVYPPEDEDKYIAEARRRYRKEFVFIDLRQLYVRFIGDMGWYGFSESFKENGIDMFKSVSYPQKDFFSLIQKEINRVINTRRIPVIIHFGCIYGMGLSTVDFDESEVIMKSNYPLIIFFPGSVNEEGTCIFLNVQSASSYRCAVIK